MTKSILAAMAILFGGCATMQLPNPKVSILVDLDPASTDRTVIIEPYLVDVAK